MQYIPQMTTALNLQTRYFDTAEGIRLHAKVCGPSADSGAPTLLFVHGFPEFWYSWRKQLAEFSKDYRCVAIDLRGFNLSSQPTEVAAYKPALLVADLCAVINQLGAPVHAVIAHDWGGAVAWSLAAQYPELMGKFVVLIIKSRVDFKGNRPPVAIQWAYPEKADAPIGVSVGRLALPMPDRRVAADPSRSFIPLSALSHRLHSVQSLSCICFSRAGYLSTLAVSTHE